MGWPAWNLLPIFNRKTKRHMTRKEVGPIYGVELIDTLPIGNSLMHQALPNREDLIDVRDVSERTAAGYEVLLEHYKRASRVVSYLDNPQVLLAIPQPHRMRLSELMDCSR